jgi:hypothetical protein
MRVKSWFKISDREREIYSNCLNELASRSGDGIDYRVGDVLKKIFDFIQLSFFFGHNPLSALRDNLNFQFRYHELSGREELIEVLKDSDYILELGFVDNHVFVITITRWNDLFSHRIIVDPKMNWDQISAGKKDEKWDRDLLKEAQARVFAIVGEKTNTGLYDIT